jgi:hypothetical protein
MIVPSAWHAREPATRLAGVFRGGALRGRPWIWSQRLGSKARPLARGARQVCPLTSKHIYKRAIGAPLSKVAAGWTWRGAVRQSDQFAWRRPGVAPPPSRYATPLGPTNWSTLAGGFCVCLCVCVPSLGGSGRRRSLHAIVSRREGRPLGAASFGPEMYDIQPPSMHLVASPRLRTAAATAGRPASRQQKQQKHNTRKHRNNELDAWLLQEPNELKIINNFSPPETSLCAPDSGRCRRRLASARASARC